MALLGGEIVEAASCPWTAFNSVIRLFFKIFFILKYIKIIIFYFLKIIFDISKLK